MQVLTLVGDSGSLARDYKAKTSFCPIIIIPLMQSYSNWIAGIHEAEMVGINRQSTSAISKYFMS